MDFTTAELLAITGVSSSVFKQWIRFGHVALSSGEGPGTGNHRRHASRDVLQVAILAELARLGVPPGRAKRVWLLAVAPSINVPGSPPPTVLLAPRSDGSDHDVRVVFGDDFGLAAPDAPASFVVLRAGTIARRLAERIAGVKGVPS